MKSVSVNSVLSRTMIVALSKVYGIPVTRKTASGLVKDMMLALGALGVVEVATRPVAGGS